MNNSDTSAFSSSARNLTTVSQASNASVSTSVTVLASSQVAFTTLSTSSRPSKVDNSPEPANPVASPSISASVTTEPTQSLNMTSVSVASNSSSRPVPVNPAAPTEQSAPVSSSGTRPAASNASSNSSGASSSSASAAGPSESSSKPVASQTSADSRNAGIEPAPTPSSSTTSRNSPASSTESVQKAQKSPDSTSFQVVTNDGPTSTITTRSTLSGQPDSTFSTPVGVLTTNAFNGQASTTFPPFVTVVSTTVNGEGSSVTLTDIVANPTGSMAVDGDIGHDSSFFQNQGAVAGVFLCVGIAVASLFAALVLLCRRRRKRRQQRQQWVESVRRRLPSVDSPFVDQEDMRQVGYYDSTPATAVPLTNPERTYGYDPRTPIPATSTFRNAGYDNMGHTFRDQPSASPFSDLYAYKPTEIGIAVTTNTASNNIPVRENAQSPSRLSLVQSSPSIYPPTIPLSNDDVSSIYDEVDLPQEEPQPLAVAHAKQDSVSVLPPLIPTPSTTIPVSETSETVAFPPRPPRSSLRETPSKTVMEYRPLTPPESSQGHGGDSSSNPPSPIGYGSSAMWSVEQRAHQVYTPPSSGNSKNVAIEDIFNRRTLLGIRPRPSADNVGTR